MSIFTLKKIFFGAILVVTCTTAIGCGKDTAPAVISSHDELTQYLDEHPELKNAPEDVINTNGI